MSFKCSKTYFIVFVKFYCFCKILLFLCANELHGNFCKAFLTITLSTPIKFREFNIQVWSIDDYFNHIRLSLFIYLIHEKICNVKIKRIIKSHNVDPCYGTLVSSLLTKLQLNQIKSNEIIIICNY